MSSNPKKPPHPIETDPQGRRLCGAQKRGGRGPCRAPAMAAQERCRLHGGSSPQALARAKQRMLEALDPLAGELVRLAREARKESVRVRAIEAVMDRSGLHSMRGHEVSGEGGGPVAFRVILTEKEEDGGKESGNG